MDRFAIFAGWEKTWIEEHRAWMKYRGPHPDEWYCDPDGGFDLNDSTALELQEASDGFVWFFVWLPREGESGGFEDGKVSWRVRAKHLRYHVGQVDWTHCHPGREAVQGKKRGDMSFTVAEIVENNYPILRREFKRRDGSPLRLSHPASGKRLWSVQCVIQP